MNFRIADTLTHSLAPLAGDSQKAVGGRITVKATNHLGDETIKVLRVY